MGISISSDYKYLAEGSNIDDKYSAIISTYSSNSMKDGDTKVNMADIPKSLWETKKLKDQQVITDEIKQILAELLMQSKKGQASSSKPGSFSAYWADKQSVSKNTKDKDNQHRIVEFSSSKFEGGMKQIINLHIKKWRRYIIHWKFWCITKIFKKWRLYNPTLSNRSWLLTLSDF